MWRIAAILRPLRSKRAMISPVRPRANASGLTRMRVRSIEVLWSGSAGAGRRFGGDGGLICRRGAPAAAGRGRGRGPGLGLAVGAQLPGGVDRLAARVAA